MSVAVKKLVDIRMLDIENDRLVTSLVYCAISGTKCPRWRLLSYLYYTTTSNSHGRATSSALAHLDH